MARSATTVKVDVSTVRKDAILYCKVLKAIDARDVYPLLNVTEENFKTPPFKKHAPEMLAKIPPRSVLTLFENARTAWREARGSNAIALLSPEDAGSWKSAAIKLKVVYERKLKVIQKLEDLANPINEKEWPFVVKAIRVDLAGADDIGYRKTFETPFTQALNSARLAAVLAFDIGKRSWEEYESGGKINQTHRLSTSVTPEYVVLAKSLHDASDGMTRWKRLTAMIAENAAPKRLAMWEEVMKECKFQWRRMDEVKLLISKSVIERKLKHLPEPSKEWK